MPMFRCPRRSTENMGAGATWWFGFESRRPVLPRDEGRAGTIRGRLVILKAALCGRDRDQSDGFDSRPRRRGLQRTNTGRLNHDVWVAPRSWGRVS